MAVPQTLSDLLAYGIQRTPDGRFFLPESSFSANQPVLGDDGRYAYGYTVHPEDGYSQTTNYYDTLDQAQAAESLSDAPRGFISYNSPSHQWGALYNTNGMSADDMAALKAQKLGDQYGFFLDPNRLGFTDQTVAGGDSTKPNESGAWQLLSILAPALGAVGSFGLDQIASSSVGAAGVGADATGAAAATAGNVAADSAAPAATDATTSATADTSTLAGSQGSTQLSGSGGMDNYFEDYVTDPNTGDVYSANSGADVSGGVDQYGNPTSGNLNFQGGNTNDFYNPSAVDASGNPLPTNYLSDAQKILSLLKAGAGAAGGKTLGQSILGQVGSDPLSAAFSATPFLLALNEANKQGGDINDVLGRLRGLESSVSGNTSPYMNAILNPYDQETGTGRAALVQDQGLRGIRGSSFGDQALNSYDYTRGLGRGDIASKALLGSTALQGNLIGSELDAITKRNTNRNLLLGAGLSASGKLFQPQQDPFNLKSLLGL